MRFSYFIIILAVFFFLGCEEISTFNPLDPENNPDFVSPETTLITENLEGTILDTSSVAIKWQGNSLVSEFSYSLDSLGWSSWSIDTSVTLDYLDEGLHSFYVKGRYASLTEDDSPSSVSFEVDALQGPGLRVYPLFSIINADTLSNSLIKIYAEEVDSLVLAEFKIEYDPAIASIAGYYKGEILNDVETSSFIVEETYGVMKVNFATLSHTGLTGTGSIIDLEFTGQSVNSTSIEIKDAVFRDVNNNDIPVIDIGNGIIVVE